MSSEPLTSDWYYAKAGAPAGQESGPFSWQELFMLAHAGTISPTDIVWNPKLPRGVTAGLVPGLFAPAADEPGHHFATPAAVAARLAEPGEPVTPAAAPQAMDYSTEEQVQTDALLLPVDEPLTPKAKKQSRSLPWLIVLLVLILAAAGVAAYFLYFRDAGVDMPTSTTNAALLASPHLATVNSLGLTFPFA